MTVATTAWSLSKLLMAAPIIGMSKIERVDEALQAVNIELSKEEVDSIDPLYEPKNVIGISEIRRRILKTKSTEPRSKSRICAAQVKLD
jgi:diketogulonate reductase-like aldo/keto reductase